ncbi:uncharacterized protein MCYG_02415 [Microsporum canis CBS 113480]|uniref:Uncharacterized protein n=1 Tax=Arthroderma otae (strain ATCC MYA-4605 / CBS 113480) TaxID=554155 RepID=C5FFR1_ARTOC|nr:uncharacterized protein MCYG_02415 [Microsporum canis CBS 113480]EEQ29596.1 predicted protein [Microsporum canis CBS 113480]
MAETSDPVCVAIDELGVRRREKEQAPSRRASRREPACSVRTSEPGVCSNRKVAQRRMAETDSAVCGVWERLEVKGGRRESRLEGQIEGRCWATKGRTRAKRRRGKVEVGKRSPVYAYVSLPRKGVRLSGIGAVSGVTSRWLEKAADTHSIHNYQNSILYSHLLLCFCSFSSLTLHPPQLTPYIS